MSVDDEVDDTKPDCDINLTQGYHTRVCWEIDGYVYAYANSGTRYVCLGRAESLSEAQGIANTYSDNG